MEHHEIVKEMRGILAKFEDKTYNPFVDGERFIDLMRLERERREGRRS